MGACPALGVPSTRLNAEWADNVLYLDCLLVRELSLLLAFGVVAED